MKYRKRSNYKNKNFYGLEKLQQLREETSKEESENIQKQIDQHFFGTKKRRKNKKQRRREKRKELKRLQHEENF